MSNPLRIKNTDLTPGCEKGLVTGTSSIFVCLSVLANTALSYYFQVIRKSFQILHSVNLHRSSLRLRASTMSCSLDFASSSLILGEEYFSLRARLIIHPQPCLELFLPSVASANHAQQRPLPVCSPPSPTVPLYHEATACQEILVSKKHILLAQTR